MKQEKDKRFGLRINSELLEKLHHVCDYEERSVNSQLIKLILRCVAEYEKEHGKIELEAKE